MQPETLSVLGVVVLRIPIQMSACYDELLSRPMLQGYNQSDIAASELVHAVAVGEVVMAHLSFVKQSELVAVRDQHSVSVSAPDQLCLVAEF